MSNIAFDLDGVLAKEYWWLGRLFKGFPLTATAIRDNLVGVLYRPLVSGIIITGRIESESDASTIRWLERKGISYKLIAFNHIGWRFDQIVECKAFWLRKFEIDIFVESEWPMIVKLRELVPDVRSITVNEALLEGLLHE